MTGRIVSASPQCPKCKSYMVFPRIKDGVEFHKCRDCGHKLMPKRNWKVYFERFEFWKS